MYRYILFDLDGTLTDPKEGITKCVQYALQYFGIRGEHRGSGGFHRSAASGIIPEILSVG